MSWHEGFIQRMTRWSHELGTDEGWVPQTLKQHHVEAPGKQGSPESASGPWGRRIRGHLTLPLRLLGSNFKQTSLGSDWSVVSGELRTQVSLEAQLPKHGMNIPGGAESFRGNLGTQLSLILNHVGRAGFL